MHESRDNSSIDEHRTSPRTSCEIPVGWHIQEHVFRDRIRNISTGGVYIETHKMPAVGTSVTLRVPIGNMQTKVSFHGKVVRINHEGIAVVFTGLTDTQEQMIRNFLKRLEMQDNQAQA